MGPLKTDGEWAADHEAKVGVDALVSPLTQLIAVCILDSNYADTTCDCIKACRDRNDVDFMKRAVCGDGTS
jgi:methylmalonyl-CoA mutase cobalamin-binding subunit